MKEYIERGELMKELERFPHLKTAESVVRSMPKADVVEVVRCGNCAVPHNKWTGCQHLNGLIPPPDHYCARGERKEQK